MPRALFRKLQTSLGQNKLKTLFQQMVLLQSSSLLQELVTWIRLLKMTFSVGTALSPDNSNLGTDQYETNLVYLLQKISKDNLTEGLLEKKNY